MSARKKTPSDAMKRFSFIMNQEREEKINLLMKVFGKNTISSLIDHLLDVASVDPDKFDYIQPQDSSEERIQELKQLLKKVDSAVLDRKSNLEKQVGKQMSQIQELKELLAIGLPAVKNHLNDLEKKDKPLVSEDEEDL